MVKTKTTEKKKNPAPETKADDSRFTVERLGEDCVALFGIGSCEYAGATHGLSGAYTVDEMRKIIGNWKNQEVK